jgi:DNA-binding PadR family transcriptional regulator
MTPRERDAVSFSAALVLQALAAGHRYGFDIMRATRLPSGTVYPLLRRLEFNGLVRSRWERAKSAHAEGRPRRRYYESTARGAAALADALPRLRAQWAVFDADPGAPALG